jgi:hypothetical protein
MEATEQAQATTTPAAPSMVDPHELAGARAWKDGDRVELTRALIRHASWEGIRYNLCAVHVVNGAAWATDGYRALFVGGYSPKAANGSYGVSRAGLSFEPMDVQPPDLKYVLSRSVFDIEPKRFSLEHFGRVRKLRGNVAISLTETGVFIGEGPAPLAAIRLGYLADLPFTDEVLHFDVRGPSEMVVVRPALSGWWAVIMPMRIDAENQVWRRRGGQ